MPPKKKPSPKKPPGRKRRANTMLGGLSKKDSSDTVVSAVDVPATPVPKTPSLRLVMGSRKMTTPSLRLNGPKPPVQQRPDLITDSFRALVQPSSPPPSQLPDSLDSMPPPDFPASKRRLPSPGRPTFGQMFIDDSQRSESPCSFRSSQPSFAARVRASVKSLPDSQVTYDDWEDREERRRQEEAATHEEEAAAEAENSQRSSQQKKGKDPAKSKTTTKQSRPPTVQREATAVESIDVEEIEARPYNLVVESFWELEKIAFNTEIEKRQLDEEPPSLYILSNTQDSKAMKHARSLGHVSWHRISLHATPSHASLTVAKHRHFNVPNTAIGQYRTTLNMALQQLKD